MVYILFVYAHIQNLRWYLVNLRFFKKNLSNKFLLLRDEKKRQTRYRLQFCIGMHINLIMIMKPWRLSKFLQNSSKINCCCHHIHLKKNSLIIVYIIRLLLLFCLKSICFSLIYALRESMNTGMEICNKKNGTQTMELDYK